MEDDDHFRKGFYFLPKSTNNRNLQFLSFQKIHTLLDFYETWDCEKATTLGCHLGYTDTFTHSEAYKTLLWSALTNKPQAKAKERKISPVQYKWPLLYADLKMSVVL